MYRSLEELCLREEQENIPFWKLVQQDEAEESMCPESKVFLQMQQMYLEMKHSLHQYKKNFFSLSGLVGNEGYKVQEARENGDILSGDFLGRVMEYALKVSESNACMKRIVAAPTAGSCGVIPSVLLAYQEMFGVTDENITKALFVAAGIGNVIQRRAFLSGAAGGCQAEIGSASAMAAGALAYLRGGTGRDIANAAALALKNLLGLACDPVAGLVEVPCVKRNVIGAVNAVTSADLTKAGVCSRIPADEVFDAMKNIGRQMNESVRETALGGLAATPTGTRIKKELSAT